MRKIGEYRIGARGPCATVKNTQLNSRINGGVARKYKSQSVISAQDSGGARLVNLVSGSDRSGGAEMPVACLACPGGL